MADPLSPNRLERLFSIWKNLTASMPLETTLQSLAEAAAAALESDACSILLYDEAQHTLRFVAAPPDQLAVMKNLGVPVERSVAGWVYTHGRPAQLNQAGGDERIFRVVDREVSEETRSLLAVPVAYHGKTIGVFEAVNKAGGDYTPEDVALLEALAAQAAVCIRGEREVQQARGAYREELLERKINKDRLAMLAQELRDATQAIIHAVDAADRPEPRGAARDVPWSLGEPGGLPGSDDILDACVRLKSLATTLDALQSGPALPAGLQIEPVQVLPLVERVVEVFRAPAAARGIALLVDVPKTLSCACDPLRASLALWNLVENACAFTGDGGWVRVRAEALPGFVKFVVIDRGIGISENDQERIFEPFVQGRGVVGRSGSAGLGLAIAKEMVEQHGGEIWVESEEGQGSTFAFLLPEGEVDKQV